MYIVYLNYTRGSVLVRCPNGLGKLFAGNSYLQWLTGKEWRYAV
jgi:hypothetical protein